MRFPCVGRYQPSGVFFPPSLCLKHMNRPLFAIGLYVCSAIASANYDATSARGVSLAGDWALNAALSDDPERMLSERLEKERQRFARLRREYEILQPPGAPPDIDVDAPPPNRPEQRPWQKQREENFRRMLGITKTLHIQQSGTVVEITSAVESRRLTAGSHTQVSMPEGQLADSNVGWDGEWFVIERRVRRGPRVVEKFRLLKTGQLEYLMNWGGDTELAGIKSRRVFDRTTTSAPAPAPNPDLGPTR
jgi:hypothetical protein